MSWLDRFAAAAAGVVGTRGAILCFHGIDLGDSPASISMHVPLSHFQAIVETCQRLARLVPLQELVTRKLAGRSTAGLMALTADDAYASWCAAAPFLARHAIPLTAFAVADAIDGGLSFWWDRIDGAAMRASAEQWQWFEDACGLPEAYRRGHAGAGPTRALRQWVLAEHAGRWPASLAALLGQLENKVGASTTQRSMTAEELSEFVAITGAHLGVHTASHAALPFLGDSELVAEIRQGHDRLRTRFVDSLPYLAIPFGLFDQRTLRLARTAGMTVSLTLEGRAIDHGPAPENALPRLCVVRENTPGLLALKLSNSGSLIDRWRKGSLQPYPALPSPKT